MSAVTTSVCTKLPRVTGRCARPGRPPRSPARGRPSPRTCAPECSPLAESDWQDVRLVSDRAEWNGRLSEIPDDSTFHFEPHFGWKDHIERA